MLFLLLPFTVLFPAVDFNISAVAFWFSIGLLSIGLLEFVAVLFVPSIGASFAIKAVLLSSVIFVLLAPLSTLVASNFLFEVSVELSLQRSPSQRKHWGDDSLQLVNKFMRSSQTPFGDKQPRNTWNKLILDYFKFVLMEVSNWMAIRIFGTKIWG